MSKRRSFGSSSCSCSSSTDSAFGAESDGRSGASPNPESVRATLDLYVTAAKVGREAFAKGDLQSAVQQFDQALALELQTELDCIYDPSIGMVSGLVRKEVAERMNAHTSPRHSPANINCNRIMQTLAQIYTESDALVRHKPSDPKLYLRMGAALCCANEWEKAKKIYTDGLNACKDRKELKLALKRLGRMEEITSGKEIPTEPYRLSSGTTERKIKTRTLPWASKGRKKSPAIEAMDLSVGTLDNRQRISKSPGLYTDRDKSPKPVRARRVSSFGRISRQRKAPDVDYVERGSWSNVFQADFCRQQVQLKPSAITQMRRLSVDILDQSSDEEQSARGHLSTPNHSLAVNSFQSMKIVDDDSELEDD